MKATSMWHGITVEILPISDSESRHKPLWQVETWDANGEHLTSRRYTVPERLVEAIWKLLRTAPEVSTLTIAPFSNDCSVHLCSGTRLARGLCKRHWRKLRRQEMGQATYSESRDSVFWSRVVEDEHGCWIWQGSRTRGDYGAFYVSPERPNVRVHRYAYQQMVGEIPEGLELDHLCRVRLCVNPDHLEPVTQAVNLHRALCARRRSA